MHVVYDAEVRCLLTCTPVDPSIFWYNIWNTLRDRLITDCVVKNASAQLQFSGKLLNPNSNTNIASSSSFHTSTDKKNQIPATDR